VVHVLLMQLLVNNMMLIYRSVQTILLDVVTDIVEEIVQISMDVH